MTIQVLVEIEGITLIEYIARAPSNHFWVVGEKMTAAYDLVDPDNRSHAFRGETIIGLANTKESSIRIW